MQLVAFNTLQFSRTPYSYYDIPRVKPISIFEKSFKLIFYTKNDQPTSNKGLFIVNVDKVNVDTESLII